jgi:hypothetical protein
LQLLCNPLWCCLLGRSFLHRLSLPHSFASWYWSSGLLFLNAGLFLNRNRGAVRAGLFHAHSTACMPENLA